MPSIGSAPRQIPSELRFYTPGILQPGSFKYCYFQPAPNNYVGNYTPGEFGCSTASTINYINSINNNTGNFAFNAHAVFRNLGKTVRGTNGIGIYNGQNVQLLAVTGDINSATYNTSGVIGAPTVPNWTTKSSYYNLYIGEPIQGQGRVTNDITPSGGSM